MSPHARRVLAAVPDIAPPAPGSSRLGLPPVPATTWSLAEHFEVHGLLPDLSPSAIVAEVTAAGLTGRGGAAFPVHRKMAGVLAGPAPRIVVANGAEGEPASAKDKTLLSTNPHLTLDGLQLAARAVAAERAFVYLHPHRTVLDAVTHAVLERRLRGVDEVPVEVVVAEHRFVAGEESAVVSRISGGAAVPRSKPPRVFESGAFGRPTLVHNVETLAHFAVLARTGAAEFRSLGMPDQPGTMLFTVSGAVHRPGVYEEPVGVGLDALLDRAGGPSHHVRAILLGGYHGTWVSWPQARELQLSNSALRPHGLAVGAGVVVVLPAEACGLAESVRVLDYLAAESAGQCGPCVFGLPRVARTFHDVAGGSRRRRTARRLTDLAGALERRGGCHHPDGSVRFLRSALTAFADERELHARGRCSATSTRPVLPIPTTAATG